MPEKDATGEIAAFGEDDEGGEGFARVDRVEKDAVGLGKTGDGGVSGFAGDAIAGADELGGQAEVGGF